MIDTPRPIGTTKYAVSFLADEEQLYWGVMLDELTIIYGASSEKQTLLDFGFSEVPDDWCGYLFHEGDRLRRKEMERLGIKFSEDRS